MQVRWLVYCPGHGGPHYPGEVAELEPGLARRLIESGAAEPAEKAAEAPQPGGK